MNSNTRFALALVTGASSGIGMAVARLLAKKGIPLIVTGRNRVALEKLVDELKPLVSVEMLQADLLTPEGRAAVVDVIRKKVPDLLINNAGIGSYGPALSHETQKQVDILKLDGEVVLELALESARAMIAKETPGVIMNIASAAAFQPMPYFTVYSATKGFVTQFSEAFDEEVRGRGVRVLAACPGVVATNFQQRAGGHQGPRDLVMTSEFAAEEIWKQVIARKKVHIFNWIYRIFAFISRYVFPKKLIYYMIKRNIASRGVALDS